MFSHFFFLLLHEIPRDFTNRAIKSGITVDKKFFLLQIIFSFFHLKNRSIWNKSFFVCGSCILSLVFSGPVEM